MSVEIDFSTMLAGWQRYRATVMPADAGPVQSIECRRAFYAGAAHLYGALIDNAVLPEAEAMARLEVFDGELERFLIEVTEGRA